MHTKSQNTGAGQCARHAMSVVRNKKVYVGVCGCLCVGVDVQTKKSGFHGVGRAEAGKARSWFFLRC